MARRRSTRTSSSSRRPGTRPSKNLAEYFGAGEDTIYLSGMAAGAATKKGVIGYVVPFAIPEVIRHANAFALGAQAMHPGAKVKLVWTNSLVRPGKEKKAAESLAPARRRRARPERRLARPPGSTPRRRASRGSATTPTRRRSRRSRGSRRPSTTGARTTSQRVKAAMDGTWKTGFYYGSIKDGFTRLAPYGPRVSAKTKAAIAAKKAAIEERHVLRVPGPALRPERASCACRRARS